MSLNLYTYTANNPLRYIDPSGHDYVMPSSKEIRNMSKDTTFLGMLGYFLSALKINQNSGYDSLLNSAASYDLQMLKRGYEVGTKENQTVMAIQGLALRNDGCSYLVGGCQGGSASIMEYGDGYLAIDLLLNGTTTSYVVVGVEGGPVQFECNCFTAELRLRPKMEKNR